MAYVPFSKCCVFYFTLILSFYTFYEAVKTEFSLYPFSYGLIKSYVVVSIATNLVHFILDNYFSNDTFLIGSFVYYFRLHHDEPSDFFKRRLEINNWSNALVGLICYPFSRFSNNIKSQDLYYLSFAVFFSCFITTFHKWAHLPKSMIPFYARFLQSTGIIIDQKHHKIHHTTFSENHSLFGGFVDILFTKFKVIEFFEIVIYILTSERAINTRLNNIVFIEGLSTRQRFNHMFWQLFYIWFDKRLENNKLTIYCMNWGFNNDSVDIKTIEKLYSDSTSILVEKYSLQLYFEVTKDIDFSNKTYLDISSGKGGGVSFLTEIKNPLKSFGLDFCSSNINFCKNKFENITFVQGDATNLPFKDNEIDIITNVEASHCYQNLEKFFSEVYRCLSQNGYFAYTDFGTPEKYERVNKFISERGFNVIIKKNISSSVIKSMEATTSEKKNLINHYGSSFIAPILYRFTSTKNSSTYKKFEDGRYIYFYFLLRKTIK